MKETMRLLIAEDNPLDAELMVRELRRANVEIEWNRVETEEAFRESLCEDIDLILSDYDMPQFDGLRALRILRESGLDVPLILVSGTIGEESAVAAMREGAADYLLKDRLARLAPAASHAIEQARLRRERKSMSEALMRAEARYRGIFENAVEGIFRTTPDGRVVIVNPALARLFGFESLDQVMGRDDVDTLARQAYADPTDRERIVSILGTGESVANFETRMNRIDGTPFWVSINARPALDEHGVACFEGTVVDISDRKRAQEELLARTDELARTNAALRLSEEKFAKAFRSSPVALAIVRLADEKILDVNATFRRLLGFSADEVRGKTAFDIGFRTQTSDRREQMDRLRAGSSMRGEQTELRAKSGAELSVLLSAEVIMLDDEQCALFTVVDVTERKRAERQLQRLVSLSPTVIYGLTLGPEGVSHSWVSANIEETTGYTPEEADATEWWRRNIHPDDRERVETAHTPPLASDQFVLEYRFRRKDGSYVWLHDEKRLLRDSAGEPVEVIGAWSDVTQRVQLETRLRQAQKMEALGQLSGGVAHDFNNLLTIIQGHVWAIESFATDLELKESVEAIKDAADRAANLTRQLLLFSRRQTMQKRDLDLNGVVTQLSKMLQRVLGEDIYMEFALESGSLPIHADSGMIDQVLLNLAVNARDAMPDGGHLVVETSRADLAQPDGGAFACMSVRDTGIGIPDEEIPRIFEPFYTTKEVGKGTGLGLATVFGIVEQHRGWVRVESRVGVGTTFRVYLPLETTEPQPDVAPARSPAAGGCETILLVEDETAVRTLVRNVLAGLGYRILEASSGPEALALWSKHRSDIRLLLTDMVMPDGMTGGELARRLQSDDAKLKVIYTSGYSPEFAGKNITFVEGENFLAKPFDPRTLAKAVRASLDR